MAIGGARTKRYAGAAVQRPDIVDKGGNADVQQPPENNKQGNGFLDTLASAGSAVWDTASDVATKTVPAYVDNGGGSTVGNPRAFGPQSKREAYPEGEIPREQGARDRQMNARGGGGLAGLMQSPAVVVGGVVAAAALAWAVAN